MLTPPIAADFLFLMRSNFNSGRDSQAATSCSSDMQRPRKMASPTLITGSGLSSTSAAAENPVSNPKIDATKKASVKIASIHRCTVTSLAKWEQVLSALAHCTKQIAKRTVLWDAGKGVIAAIECQHPGSLPCIITCPRATDLQHV